MLTAVLAPLRRWPIASFVVLSCVVSWRDWIASLLSGATSRGLDPFGPFVAAVIVSLAADGGRATLGLLRKLVQWRAPLRWYAFALVIPAAISVLAAAGAVWSGAPMPDAAQLARWRELFVAFPVVLVVGGPLGEELGWRGFLLPRLRQGRSELAAALAVGAFWSFWHLPLLLQDGGEALPQVVSIVSASVLLARLDRGTCGSVLLAMLMHTSQNTVGGELIGPMFSGHARLIIASLRAALYLCAAAAVVMYGRAATTAHDALPREARIAGT